MEDAKLERVRGEFGWAVEHIRRRFVEGLTRLTERARLDRRYQEFRSNDDLVYSALLAGMQNPRLAATFVGYWTVGQTLATQSRFWLEEAIADILEDQARRNGQAGRRVYTFPMLANGALTNQRTVEELGEWRRENLLSRRAWRVLLQRSVLNEIDRMVGEQERERTPARDFRPRGQWDASWNPEAQRRDEEHLKHIANSLSGPPPGEVTLQCNLLVVEPDRADREPHVWAYRFVGGKTMSSHAIRKQERINLLRLYAYLLQEKILRDPRQIRVCVTEVVPRSSGFEGQDRQPDYFSAYTYWTHTRFWQEIDVPCEVVSLAVQDAGAEFGEQLEAGLQSLLPVPQPKG